MNVRHQPAWPPTAPEPERVRWLAWATVEADDKGIERGRVAWLYRILFGEFPPGRVAKLARRVRKAT